MIANEIFATLTSRNRRLIHERQGRHYLLAERRADRSQTTQCAGHAGTDGAGGESRVQRRRQHHAHPSAPAGAEQGPSAVLGRQCQQEIQQAIREACPGVIINHTTGTSGPNYQGALDCVRETRPEIAACNAGSLNYLKVKSDNTWAWPPMMFDNAVEKVQDYLDVMKEAGTIPEFECFDVGIVRCVGMYRQTGMYSGPLEYNFVMGVASGMPADPELLPILLKLKLPEAHWQVTAIGRAEIWPLHQRCADLGGHLRTGLEDTFYLANGTKVTSNGQLIEEIAACARRAGREIASPAEARQIFGTRH